MQLLQYILPTVIMLLLHITYGKNAATTVHITYSNMQLLHITYSNNAATIMYNISIFAHDSCTISHIIALNSAQLSENELYFRFISLNRN